MAHKTTSGSSFHFIFEFHVRDLIENDCGGGGGGVRP